MKKLTLLFIVAIAAIAFAFATAPAFAMKDMKASSATTAVGEGALAGGAAAATGAAAGGSVKSLVPSEEERRKGFGAVQALAYGTHKSFSTLGIIALAKFLSAGAILLEDESLPAYSQPLLYNLVNTLAVLAWIGVIGSAVSAAILLKTPEGKGPTEESARVRKARMVAVGVFLIGLIGVALVSFLNM